MPKPQSRWLDLFLGQTPRSLRHKKPRAVVLTERAKGQNVFSTYAIPSISTSSSRRQMSERKYSTFDRCGKRSPTICRI